MMLIQHVALICAAALGASGVALGAFAAHGLKGMLQGSGQALWATASQYHLLHAVALACTAAVLCAPAWATAPKSLAWACVLAFVGGTVLFCGSLYALALHAPKVLGAVAPMGGVLLIVGWLLLGVLGWVAR